jgi:hypothetical protein
MTTRTLQDALDRWDEEPQTKVTDEDLDMILEAARLVANAIPMVRMGGLTPGYYTAADPAEADAWLIQPHKNARWIACKDEHDWRRINEPGADFQCAKCGERNERDPDAGEDQ